MRIKAVLIAGLIIGLTSGSAASIHAQSTPSPTPELSVMVTVVPPGGELADAQDAVMVYELSDGDVLIAGLIFALIVLLLLNGAWNLRRSKSALGALLVVLCIAGSAAPSQAQSAKGSWCGYALIEGIPNVEIALPLVSLLVSPEKATSDPSDLFQYRLSLDGSKALIEGCWTVFPSRDVIVNFLGLSIRDDQKETVDQRLTYSLFAPEGSREESAASVREYLAKHINEWELPIDERDGGTK